MGHLHLLGGDGHAGTDHVQRVGDHGGRGPGQGAGNETRERCQCPAGRGQRRHQTSPAAVNPTCLLGMALLCLLGIPSHPRMGNPWEEEAGLEPDVPPALCFALSVSRSFMAHGWTWQGCVLIQSALPLAPQTPKRGWHLGLPLWSFPPSKGPPWSFSSELLPRSFPLRASILEIPLGASPSELPLLQSFHFGASLSKVPLWSFPLSLPLGLSSPSELPPQRFHFRGSILELPLTACPLDLPSWSIPSQLPPWIFPLRVSPLDSLLPQNFSLRASISKLPPQSFPSQLLPQNLHLSP